MSSRRGPLDGIVVIDLTRVLAGPFLTMMLADMGARVIKVELPVDGDDARQFGPFVDGESAYFASVNRGKESIALDLRDDAERQTLRRLLRKADVVVENFRAGTFARLGFGRDVLHELNPRLVYASVSGFGHSGPYRDRPAYDLVAQGMGGVMSLTGEKGGPPVRVGTSIGDITAGLFGLNGVLAALYDREKTGRGQHVDVGMLDCQVAILENAVSRYFAENRTPEPMGIRHPSITPFAGLRARDGRYLILAAGNDRLFEKLCEVLGRDDLAADARFSGNARRTENCEALYRELEQALGARGVEEWLELLQTAGIPCGPINDVAQVVNDPQVRARNMIVEARTRKGTRFRMPGAPVKFSEYPDPETREGPPELDQHRASVMDFLAEE